MIEAPAVLEPESTTLQLLEAFFDSTPAVCVLLDDEGRIQKLNAVARQLAASSGDDLTGAPLIHLMDPNWSSLVRQRLAAATSTEATEPVVTPWLTSWGESRLIEWRCRRIVLGSRRESTLLTGTDVTDSLNRQAHDSFRQQWLGTCYDLPFFGMAILSAETGRWTDCNLRFLQLLGYSREELTRRSWRDVTHPADWAAEELEYERAVRGQIDHYSLEKRFIRNDGSMIDAGLHVKCVLRPDGSLSHLMVMIHDITQRKRAEQKIHELVLVMDQASDSIVIRDFNNGVRYVNRGTERLSGWTLSEIRGKDFDRLVYRDADACAAARRAVLENGEWSGDLTLHTRDGRQLIVESRWSLARDTDGRPHSIIAISTDITARRRAEEQVKLQTAALEAAANSILITESDGRIRWVNQAFTRMTGYSLAEVQGRTPQFLRSGRHPPEFYARMWSTLLDGGAWCGELINRRKDGSLYEEEMTITPVRNPAGEIVNFIGVKADITERKQAEKKLRDSEALYRSLMDHLPHCVFRKDREGRFTFANRHLCERLGKPQECILGKTDFDLYPPELAREYAAHDAQVLTSGRPLTLNEDFHGHDGERRVMEITRCPILDHQGEIKGIQGILLDVTDRVRAETERHRMEIQLRHAQKLEAIGHLAAGIAHEINTPTQYIGDNTRFVRDAFTDLRRIHDLYSRLLSVARDRNVDPRLTAEIEDLTQSLDFDFLSEQIPIALEQSLEGVNRVTHIVGAMKEFSHPGTEDKTPTDLNRAIESTITVSRNEWKYVADITLDLDPDLPAVPCLPGEFNQVTLNLIINAAHAVADVVHQQPGTRGTIAVATRRLGHRVEIRISDTGPGIPPEVRSRIFDPFFTTKPVGRGTGQGLAIAHSVIVEKHGGSIRFETETGKGTTFIIELPLDASARATPPLPAP